MLNGVLTLGDIRNVEKACDRIISQALIARRSRLSPAEREELLAFLVAEAWLLWRRYDPTRGAKFSTFAYPQLRMRVLDWWKKKLGRGAGPGEWGVESTDALDDDELERSLGARERDDPLARLLDYEWAVTAGGGQVVGHADARGGGTPRRAA